MVILASSAFLARMVCAYVPLGRLFINPGRAVRIQDEVFYASDLREVASEEFCGQPCTENFAVRSGMTFGLVELAVGVILILVPGPGVSGGLPLFGIDSVVVLALDVFSLVVDILVVSRAFLFWWASSAGCTSGRGFSSPLPLR